ncbi:Os10g0520100 [Oryza sativa Japonica Group]|nr:hypothetical protein [Oryza sativa Japonica Group]AAP54656.1 F-box domain containing protein [Oryza sativa Japonica Group]USI00228.1 F-box and DUF domain-containing protein [Oryza sativa Japonica Group]BAF26998.2 Os10g0520100 [Oryza sativa Japonica Group]|eukprot:NP_001065084.2 Os10g0520100 [Oryza sativa Japonica Group]
MDWSSLPADLLLAVFARLPRDADRARFRAVCAGWGAAAASWRPRPWFVGSRTDRFGRGAAMSSFWLSRRSRGGGGLVPFAAAVPAGLEFLSSSSHGYLALSDPMATPKAVALVNPVTGRRIRLPPIGFFKRWHDVATVVLSADPDTADEWAAVAVGFPTNCLAYYSSAAGAWTPLGFSAAGYAGVEHFRGRFYVAFKSQLCVCDVEATVPAVIPLEQLIDDDDGGGENVDTGRRVVETHLVECDGELLLVSVHDNLERNPEDTTIFGDDDDHDGSSSSSSDSGDGRVVEVLRVEWVAGGAVRLVRQEDLRSRALFLGRNHAFALSPEEFPSCRANCVYLVDQQGHPDGRVRVFDMNADERWEPEEAAVVARNYARRDETIFPPDDGRRDAQSAGWARRGWFFPKY